MRAAKAAMEGETQANMSHQMQHVEAKHDQNRCGEKAMATMITAANKSARARFGFRRQLVN